MDIEQQDFVDTPQVKLFDEVVQAPVVHVSAKLKAGKGVGVVGTIIDVPVMAQVLIQKQVQVPRATKQQKLVDIP